MPTIANKVKELEGCRPSSLTDEILTSTEPLVLRGLVADWPLVQAARESRQAADQYLRRFYNGMPVTVTYGAPEIKGRVAYTEDLTQVNVQRARMALLDVLDKIEAHAADAEPPLYYVASTTIGDCLPGLTAENPMGLAGRTPLESIWIGNPSHIPAHYDVPNNIACVAVGRRRFTLFPPEQLANLYVGPSDMTPAGQPISVVDFRAPDFDKYPKYREALDAALVADLEPGDAIFIPSMWWHQVESLSSFNVLMNYWWRQSPAYMGAPVDALTLALLAVRDLPPEQKLAWKGIFDHYVFENTEETVAHIPESVRGSLGPIDENWARRILAQLLNRLNR